MSGAAMRRGLVLLATLCLIAGVALSARLLPFEGVFVTPDESRDVVASAQDGAPLAVASNGQPTDRSQDRPSPSKQQAVGLEESEDSSAKKFVPAFALQFAPFDVRDEYAGLKPERALIEGGSDDPPPNLLQRPPPAG